MIEYSRILLNRTLGCSDIRLIVQISCPRPLGFDNPIETSDISNIRHVGQIYCPSWRSELTGFYFMNKYNKCTHAYCKKMRKISVIRPYKNTGWWQHHLASKVINSLKKFATCLLAFSWGWDKLVPKRSEHVVNLNMS